jgi:hypothetical protein
MSAHRYPHPFPHREDNRDLTPALSRSVTRRALVLRRGGGAAVDRDTDRDPQPDQAWNTPNEAERQPGSSGVRPQAGTGEPHR